MGPSAMMDLVVVHPDDDPGEVLIRGMVATAAVVFGTSPCAVAGGVVLESGGSAHDL